MVRAVRVRGPRSRHGWTITRRSFGAGGASCVAVALGGWGRVRRGVGVGGLVSDPVIVECGRGRWGAAIGVGA